MAKKILNLVFFGPQGSGKGTQAKLLAKKISLYHLSSGEALRASAQTNAPLGRYLKRQLAGGTLTPIPKLVAVFEQNIKKVPKNQGLILDGFARQITETKILLSWLEEMRRRIDLALYIKISTPETIRRLSKRGLCNTCQHLFILGGKLKFGSRCPRCGGTIIQRDDDKPKAIKKRLNLFHKRTKRVISYFASKNLIEKINGEQPIAKVHTDILKVLRRRKLIR